MIADTYDSACKEPEQQAFRSDDVCPACSETFLGLVRRATERRWRRQRGEEVVEEDLELVGEKRELFDWWMERGTKLSATQLVQQIFGLGVGADQFSATEGV